jgi:hypothetical protein
MDRARRHLRSLVVAIAALALSSGLVAGRDLPDSADHGRATAADAAGKVVPVGPPTAPGAPAAGDPTRDDATDPAVEAAGGEHPENHGQFVSEAAGGETADEFDTHGEYVSSVARGDAGKPDAATTGRGKADAAPGRTRSEEARGQGGD